MTHRCFLFPVIVCISLWTASVSSAQDAYTHTTAESLARSGYDYLWSIIQDEYGSVKLDDPDDQNRYEDLIDHAVCAAALYKESRQTSDATTRKLFAQIIKLDNDPPLYLQYRYHSVSISRTSSNKELLEHGNALYRIAQRMDESGYPPYAAGAAWVRAAEMLRKTQDSGVQSRDDFALEHGMKLLVSAAALGDIDPRFQEFVALRIAQYGFEYSTFTANEKELFCSMLSSDQNADPWITELSNGCLYKRIAWEVRGTRVAQDTPAQKLIEFNRLLTKANAHLERAYEIRPEWPGAASQLILVTMGHQIDPSQGPDFWFTEAIKQRIDDPMPYRFFARALSPQWGGSYQSMFALSDYAIELSNNFESMGPILLLTLHATSQMTANPNLVLLNQKYLPTLTQLFLDDIDTVLRIEGEDTRNTALRTLAFANFEHKNYHISMKLLEAGGAESTSIITPWSPSERFRRFSLLVTTPVADHIISGLQALDKDDHPGAVERLEEALSLLQDPELELQTKHTKSEFVYELKELIYELEE